MKNTTREKTYCIPGITNLLPLLGQVVYKVIIIPLSQTKYQAQGPLSRDALPSVSGLCMVRLERPLA